MKSGYKSLASKVASALVLAMMCHFVTSCNKSQDVEHVAQGGETKLQVTVAGIQQMSSGSAEKKAVATESKPLVRTYKEFDAVVALNDNVQSNSHIRINGKSATSASSAAKAAAIGSNVAYRLFLYKADGTFVSSTLLNSSTTGALDVVAGESYNWYALSYNTAESVPDVTTGSTSLQLPKGKDVLYASGSISIPEVISAPIPLAIIFKHKTSRIGIELNSMGMFGKMNSATVTVAGLSAKTGTLDLTTGKWTNLVDSTQSLTFADFKDVEAGFQDRKIAYVYTVDSTSVNNISVKINSLNLTHADGNVRQFSASDVTFPTVAITPGIGTDNTVLLNLVESPLTTTIGGTTTRWARSHLYYSPGRNPYRFYGTNNQLPNSAENLKAFFSFQGHIPGKFANSANKIDPCTQVYPQGVWRTPTYTETSKLTSTSGLLTNVLGDVLGIVAADPAPGSSYTSGNTYVDYQTSAGGGNVAFDAASNVLRFYFNGAVANVGIVGDGWITLNLGDTYGREATLWTNTEGLNLLGLVGVGAWGYHGARRAALFGGAYVKGSSTAELLSNIDLLGINVVTSSAKNVRCVRN